MEALTVKIFVHVIRRIHDHQIRTPDRKQRQNLERIAQNGPVADRGDFSRCSHLDAAFQIFLSGLHT